MQTMTKAEALTIVGGITHTSKMPCPSYSLPTIACVTGFKMKDVSGAVCAACYANKGFYAAYANTIEPAQHARLVSLSDPLWIDAMVRIIADYPVWRWHDSGDLQSIEHLEMIAQVCRRTPNTRHWLPTREYGMVAAYCAQHDVPKNLVIRLSAMFPDKPVKIPASLQGIAGVTASNVHKDGAPIGDECRAPSQNGECRECRACWNREKVISYAMH